MFSFIYYYYYYCFLKNKNNRNTPPPNPPRPPQTHPFSTVTHPAIQPQQQIKPAGNLTNILTAHHTHRKTHRPHKSQPTTGDPPPKKPASHREPLHQRIHNNPSHREPPHQQTHNHQRWQYPTPINNPNPSNPTIPKHPHHEKLCRMRLKKQEV
jgi:hypothetical protein